MPLAKIYHSPEVSRGKMTYILRFFCILAKLSFRKQPTLELSFYSKLICVKFWVSGRFSYSINSFEVSIKYNIFNLKEYGVFSRESRIGIHYVVTTLKRQGKGIFKWICHVAARLHDDACTVKVCQLPPINIFWRISNHYR